MDKPTDENSSAQQCSTTAVCGDSESSTNHNSLPPQGEFSGSSLEDIFHPSPSLIVLPSKNCILDDDVEKDSVSRHRLSHKSIDRASEEKEVIEETDNDQELDKGVGWKHFYHQCEFGVSAVVNCIMFFAQAKINWETSAWTPSILCHLQIL